MKFLARWSVIALLYAIFIIQDGPKKQNPGFNFAIRKCTLILTTFLLLQQEMYDA